MMTRRQQALRDAQHKAAAEWAEKAARKPFTVWSDNLGRDLRYATFAEAENYARRVILKQGGTCRVAIEYRGELAATCFIDWRDRVVVDMAPAGCAFA